MALAVTKPATDNDYYGALHAERHAIEQRYRDLTPASRVMFKRAADVFPGGYTRDAVMRDPYPTFAARASGDVLTDIDERPIVDFWFNATSLPLGHADPRVIAAVSERLPHGTAYYAPTEHEIALAELLIDRVPCAERVRFTNSGSEAVMLAIRFARAARTKRLIVKFEGSYHGSYDDVSWSVSPKVSSAGSSEAPRPVAETRGLAGADGRVAVLPFNDSAVLRRYVETHHVEIAALLLEPMANRIGLLLPDLAFLQTARELCDRYGIVLIFDEVISFRVGYRGAQGELGVTPDIASLGKIIGGGFPVGAVVGRADILDLSSLDTPGGRVTHAGTFNANPITMVAGLTTMTALTPETFDRINAMGGHIRSEFTRICDGLPLQVTGAGSLFKVTATARPIRDYRDAATADRAWESLASLALLNEGFIMTGNLAGCVSAATTPAHAEALIDTFRSIVAG